MITAPIRRMLSWVAAMAAALPCLGGIGETTGIVYPLHDVSLSFPVDGRVMSILVQEGDQVRKGQVLMVLDDHLQTLEVERRKLIWEDTSQLHVTQENLQLLEEVVAVKQKLYEASKSVSQAELKHHRMQLNKLRGECRMLEAAERTEKIQYEISRQVLSSYSVTAPISGVVVEVMPEAGEWVRTGEPVLRVIDTSVCFMELNVEMSAVGGMTRRQTGLSIVAPARTGEVTRAGRVGYISPIVDDGSGLTRVKVFIDNADSQIVPGVAAQLFFQEGVPQPPNGKTTRSKP